MRYTRFPNRNFLIIVLIQGGYSSAIVGLSVAEKGKLEYAHCHTPIRKVNKGIVRIEQSVEAKMICDANMASPPYLSAKNGSRAACGHPRYQNADIDQR